MLEKNVNNCQKLTKMTNVTQNKKLRLFAKVDLVTKLEIVNQQKSIFHKLKGSYSDVDNHVLTLSSLILAVDTVTKKIDDVNLNAIKLRVENNNKKVKRQKLLDYWAIVRTLRLEEKMSFRQISEYFAKYHKLKFSYSTIYDVWNELENNTKIKEN